MKRKLALLLTLLLVLSLFAGCGGDPAQSGNGGGTAAGGNTGSGEAAGGNSAGGSTADDGGTETPPPADDDSPYKFAAGNYPLDEEGFPAEKYVYELPFCTTDEVLTNWSTNWTPQYLPEGGYSDVPLFKEMMEMTGVHMEWSLVSADTRAQNLSVMLASDDLLDILGQFNYFYTSGTMEQAIEEQYIVNLHDYRDYMPNYLWEVQTRSKNSTIKDTVFYKDDIWVAFFGMYITPQHSTGYFLRQDWMDALGLGKASDLVTYDDLYEVLQAFKVNYAEASPMMVYSTFELEPLNWLGYNTTPLNSGLTYLRVKDGKVMFTGTDQDDRELMQLLNKWWLEGLIDPNYSAYTNTNTMINEISNSQLGCAIFTPSEIDGLETTCIDPDVEWAPYPRLRRSADQTIYWGLNARHTNYGSASVSASCENIELAVTWLDWNYSDFGYDWMNWGPESDTVDGRIDEEGALGYFWYYTEDGKRRLTDWCLNHPAGSAWLTNCMGYNELADPGVEVWERDYAYEGGDRFLAMFDVWSDVAQNHYENKWNWPASIVFEADDTSEINAALGDVNTYFQENYAGFFEGSLSFDQWDTFQQNMLDMGLARVLEIYQRYYDDYAA